MAAEGTLFRNNWYTWCILMGLYFSSTDVVAQFGRNSPGENRFQVGIDGGINFSVPHVLQAYQILGNSGLDEHSGVKQYDAFFRNPGHHEHFLIHWKLKDRVFLMLRPGFMQMRYGYSNRFSWYSRTNPENSFHLIFRHKQVLRYFELPVHLTYHLSNDYPTFYVFGGGSYGYLQGATKEVLSQEEITNAVGVFTVNTNVQNGDISSELATSRFALSAGAGYAYELGNLVIFGEFYYEYGLQNVTRPESRYSNQQFIGSTYDTFDDVKLDNLGVTLGVLFFLNKPKSNASKLCK